MKDDFLNNPLNCFTSSREEQNNCWINLLASGENIDFSFLPINKWGNCLECSFFQKLSSRSSGRRTADRIAEEFLKTLMGQVRTYDGHLEKINTDLKKKLEELSLLKTVSDALLKSKDLDKSLRIVLTGVTSGETFGFNRSFIFLVNPKTLRLEGRIGLGPVDEEEAFRIWSQIKEEKLTFEQMLEKILSCEEEENILTLKVKELSFSMEEKDNILVKSIIERKSYNLDEEKIRGLPTGEFLGLFSQQGFMLIPIHSENRALGLLVVDNLITKNKILEEDRVALETFANQAAAQIENILLQSELKIKLKELEHTTQLLRENQNYLLQAERLVDIGKLATTVAHEVKTPLVAIGGFAHRALKKAEEGKLISGELEIILKETQRLESITSEILDYSKVTRLNYEKMDLNLLIKDALEVLKDKLKYNGIKLKIRLSADAFVVEIDSKRIKQVLFNLVENAIEAMPQGGVLTVWTRKKEDLILFEIADTGSGISQEHMEKLYIPFFTTKPKGSGLGLSVSKKIISDHSGYIEVKSEINKGTKFTVYLPFSRVER